MPMNLRRAEGIIGFDIDLINEGDTWMAACNWEYGTVTIRDPDKKKALIKLVDETYRLRSAMVRKLAGYRCEHCGNLGPTEIDHKVPRARGGRDDRMSNLRAVCPSAFGCKVHHLKHG